MSETVQDLVQRVYSETEYGMINDPCCRETVAVRINQELVKAGVTGLRARLVPAAHDPHQADVELHIVDVYARVPDGWYTCELAKTKE